MTKEHFIETYADQFDMDFKYDLESVIQQAIAEHEAKQWKKYPENQPEKDGYPYMVTIMVSDHEEVMEACYLKDHKEWVTTGMDKLYFDVIAFRELPAPYKEEGDG